MDALIKKSTRLSGEVTVPGSKSYTHRVIAAAALYGSSTLVKNPSNSHANKAMIGVCRKLGATIDLTDDQSNIKIKGVRGKPSAPGEIHVGNSGTALRIAVALASLGTGKTRIDGDASLQHRPTGPLITALNCLGSQIKGVSKGDEQYAPIDIDAHELEGGNVSISGEKSSQYLTSLLMVSNFAKKDVEIKVEGTLVSQPYIKMTLEVLRRFGVEIENSYNYRYFYVKSQQNYNKPDEYIIPGDYSQAAFFLAAACLIDSDITVKGLTSDDQQGDKEIISILEKMGAKIEHNGSDYRIRGSFDLEGIEVDLIDSPDLFPVLSVLGVYAKGKMRLYNMPQIRSKETDRISVIEREFRKHGIKTESDWDEMTVYHSELSDTKFDFSVKGEQGVSDHRIAMALSLIGLRNGSCILRESNSIEISYPDYFPHLRQIGAEIDDMPENLEHEKTPLAM